MLTLPSFLPSFLPPFVLNLFLNWGRAFSIIGPQQHYMVEMERVMWREGDLFRAREQEQSAKAELAAKEVSSSMGSLGLQHSGQVATGRTSAHGRAAVGSKRYTSKGRVESKASRAAEQAEEAGAKTQGDSLRAMRARNTAAASSKEPVEKARGTAPKSEAKEGTRSGGWDRPGLRLTRK